MGCIVKVSRHGTLALRLFWRGDDSWEGTGLKDTLANREILDRLAKLITAEIRVGIFDARRYLHYFPNGNRVSTLIAPLVEPNLEVPTVRGFYGNWIEQQQPPTIRASLHRDRRNASNRYILPVFGTMPLSDLTRDHLERFRKDLLTRQDLALKTTRNIIDGIFRALYRDARQQYPALLAHDPFAALHWPRLPQQPPDPMSEAERDAVLDYFHKVKPFEHPFLATLFLTGMRPGEAVAVRWRRVDVQRRTLDITTSRHLGYEGAPKTAASTRTIRIPQSIAQILAEMRSAGAGPDDYVFTSRAGTPIDQSEWPKTHFYPALAALEVRRRKFYATRHTYISLALTYNANIKHLAEHCGTSVAMIEKHYGRFLGSEAQDPLSAALARNALAQGETFHDDSAATSEKPLQVPPTSEASPTGFEPVLPT